MAVQRRRNSAQRVSFVALVVLVSQGAGCAMVNQIAPTSRTKRNVMASSAARMVRSVFQRRGATMVGQIALTPVTKHRDYTTSSYTTLTTSTADQYCRCVTSICRNESSAAVRLSCPAKAARRSQAKTKMGEFCHHNGTTVYANRSAVRRGVGMTATTAPWA